MTTTKILDFAYTIQKDINTIAGINPDLATKINNFISECEAELYADTSPLGKNVEKKRTAGAKKLLKIGGTVREAYTGYKSIDGNKIALMNGYIGYIGSKIAGIPETTLPDAFNEDILTSLVDDMKKSSNTVTYTIKVSDINAQLKIAKAKAKTIKRTVSAEAYSAGIKECGVIFKDKNNDNTYFNTEYLATICDMIGTKEVKITIKSKINTALISAEGTSDIGFVVPFRGWK